MLIAQLDLACTLVTVSFASRGVSKPLQLSTSRTRQALGRKLVSLKMTDIQLWRLYSSNIDDLHLIQTRSKIRLATIRV